MGRETSHVDADQNYINMLNAPCKEAPKITNCPTRRRGRTRDVRTARHRPHLTLCHPRIGALCMFNHKVEEKFKIAGTSSRAVCELCCVKTQAIQAA